MTDQTLPAFEPTGSWCYHFARYQAIPAILAMSELANQQTVRLVDLSRRVLDAHLTKEQQELRYQRAKSNGELTVATSVKFYIPFIATQTEQLINLGGGIFRLPTAEDIDEEEVEVDALDAGVKDGLGESENFDGWIYAFSFPAIQQHDNCFPIKVGKTAGDVDSRVMTQCRQSASFENPIVLGRWQVERVGSVESAVHNVLKARNKWRENVPGVEWFDTTISEIEEIVRFVTQRT